MRALIFLAAAAVMVSGCAEQNFRPGSPLARAMGYHEDAPPERNTTRDVGLGMMAIGAGMMARPAPVQPRPRTVIITSPPTMPAPGHAPTSNIHTMTILP